ncbi:nucleotidyl transferase AbiEii/AbiGii toxin family protein [Streptomyces sp. MMS24-I29]|uniref:nucleotidyl transferase AbiEii/AbiGii toxin family protein n=1 Tax=Streptomyces sp. MMS24-I29 TaxID=3351480 RepID=UPI003C7A8970
MNLTDLHRCLLADVLAVGGAYPLALTGGYAVQAHGLVNQINQDLGVATENPQRMEDIATTVRTGLEQRGWCVRALETDPLSARLVITDPNNREECEVDILKEALWRPPVHTEHGLVLSLEDVVGTKVRALADHGLARDLIDVQATANRWSRVELEELGRRHARDSFDLSELQARLSGADWIDDTEFAAYGLDEQAVTELRQWAQTWADDIGERLQELEAPHDD